ncbi:Ig-like domain-containing protein [Enterococcus faecium]|uniref:Ig-like domain-containing protein n=1 Tax=Enterococcus faecium TaxID=1352 RepID=UPI0015D58BD5|nr:Ig-like domain-containing protein [Enterococcus faecium]MDN3041026.1 Ig-like domain-containing protein [Enterococcus faecium]
MSPESVALNKTTLSLVVGANETLTATVLPVNATNKNVTWSSSDSTIATVDTKGKVVAVKAGTTKITVKTVDGNKSAECALTVTAL